MKLLKVETGGKRAASDCRGTPMSYLARESGSPATRSLPGCVTDTQLPTAARSDRHHEPPAIRPDLDQPTTICVASTQLPTALPTTPAGRFAQLPQDVRAEAMERAKFLEYCREAKRRSPTTPDTMIVCQVAVSRAAEFPILLSSGQRGKSQLTYQNYRNWRRRIAEYRKDNGASAAGDLLALCTSYQRGSVYRSDGGIPAYGDPQFWRDFNAAYLNQNCLKLTTARDVAAFALRRRDPAAVPPSVAQCRAYVKRMPKELIVAGRMGEVAWRNSICDYVSRDWSATAPGELLIGDSRIFDTRIKVEQQDGSFRAVRPTIVCLLDARSWMPVAWTITADDVDSRVIMRTLLQYIVDQEGRVPAMCYFDNGKDYCKQGFSTPLVCGKYEHSIFKELGITLVNAQPFNARAKTVERAFRDMMQQFDKVFPDYLGSNPLERPDAAAYFDKPEHAGELPGLDAFTRIFRDWVAGYVAKPKFGGIHRGASPLEIWTAAPPAAARVVTPLELAFAFLLPEGLRKVLRGPAVTFGGRRYFCDAVRVGDEVLIKSNPFDPEMLLICAPDGAALGIARTRQAVKAIAGDDVSQQALLRGLLARQRHQEKSVRDKLSEVTGGRQGISVIEFLLSLGTDRRFVNRGTVRTIKGKSHTFKRIAPDENVFDPPALIEGNKPVTPPELPAPDAALPRIAETVDDPAPDAASIADFHAFMFDHSKEGEYDYE